MRRVLILAVLLLMASAALPARQAADSPARRLTALVERAAAVRPTRALASYAAAAASWRGILDELKGVDRAALGLDDQVDYDLLESHAKTRLYELDVLKTWETDPVSYVSFGATSNLFLRDGALPEGPVRAAIAELRGSRAVFDAGRALLKNPARTWTENAIVQCRYARLLVDESVPAAEVADPALKKELLDAALEARTAIDQFSTWLQSDLLPRSTRSPAWRVEDINVYQLGLEQLAPYDVDTMLKIAEQEETQLTSEMKALAKQIHPSGDLVTVWEAMKAEAPPWEGVIPMAQRYVDWATDWLHGKGRHVVTIPDYLDYGARLSPPMARRTLSFGGATQGPTVAGRQSGYYILTPLESWLTPAEKASRIKSYNPYWTHVISYHEWLGHTVQIAAAQANVTRPMRKLFNSNYFSQSWSFYLEKLFEDEGYYDTLPHMEKLKTMMARRQMRMWRVERIITKIRMAKGTMTFDQAVQAYIDKMGMEPTNAFIEVQRDSQNPTSPGREIIGERVILELREDAKRQMGAHYSLKRFNDTLLTYGALPFKQIRRLMLG